MRGQTRVTNSQAVTHESWLVRCSLALRNLAKAIPIICGNALPLLTENIFQTLPPLRPFYLTSRLLIFRLSVGAPLSYDKSWRHTLQPF